MGEKFSAPDGDSAVLAQTTRILRSQTSAQENAQLYSAFTAKRKFPQTTDVDQNMVTQDAMETPPVDTVQRMAGAETLTDTELVNKRTTAPENALTIKESYNRK